MKHSLLIPQCLLVLLTLPTLAVTPTYKIRSQSRDKTREVVGTVGKAHLSDKDGRWGFFSIIPEYTQSFRPTSIASSLFGSSFIGYSPFTCDCESDACAYTIAIQGSAVANRPANAWFADYFYLPRDFNGTISFKPRITNCLLDFDLYVGLDRWLPGMYVRVYGPFVHTQWDLNFCEEIFTAGTTGYPAGYFTPGALAASSLNQSFAAYASGKSPANVTGVTPDESTTNIFTGLAFARINNCSESKNGFADLRAELGWDCWDEENYHLGFNIQGAAPTGTRMHARNLFAPQIGNGHHWEAGGGVTGHYTFWRSEDEHKHVSFHLDANITHLFSAREQRTFDLKCKPLSRYMLALQFGPNTQDLSGNTIPANKQFTGVFSPVANLTTFDINVSIAAQADIVAMMNMTWGRFSWDIGYNFWGASCESFDCGDKECPSSCEQQYPNICDTSELQRWGLKGDARVYGFASDDSPPLFVANQGIALSATNSRACIARGTTGNTLDQNSSTDINQNVDSPASAAADGILLLNTPGVDAPLNTSLQPTFISCDDVDFSGVRGISNKVFTHVNYTFERETWSPYIGVGAFGEFGQSECGGSLCPSTTVTASGCSSCCQECAHCSLSQWGVWVKMGVSYN